MIPLIAIMTYCKWQMREYRLYPCTEQLLCTHPLCLVELIDLCNVLKIMVHFNEVRVEGDRQVKKLLCIGQFLALTLVLGVLHLELL